MSLSSKDGVGCAAGGDAAAFRDSSGCMTSLRGDPWDSPVGDGLRPRTPPHRTASGPWSLLVFPLFSGLRTPLWLMQAPGALCNGAAAAGVGGCGGPQASVRPGASVPGLYPCSQLPRVPFSCFWGCRTYALGSCGCLLLDRKAGAGLWTSQPGWGRLMHLKQADWDLC